MAAQPQSRSDSRRVVQRTVCSFPADINFGDVFLCKGLIKNMSPIGMRLMIPNSAWLPAEFEVSSDVFPDPVKVRTVWTNKEHVGVTIESS
ncbi:MAG: hypothetical protein AB3N20_06595 [Rhizobiaceae bacterium]